MARHSPSVLVWNNLEKALELSSSQAFGTLPLRLHCQFATQTRMLTRSLTRHIQNATSQKKTPHIAFD